MSKEPRWRDELEAYNEAGPFTEMGRIENVRYRTTPSKHCLDDTHEDCPDPETCLCECHELPGVDGPPGTA
jgi:hypothetical protein